MDKENRSIEPVSNQAQSGSQTKAGGIAWMKAFKVGAIPLVTLILGFVFNASINSRQARETFYPSVSVEFRVTEAAAHYHVPLLVSPFGYSTYRGS